MKNIFLGIAAILVISLACWSCEKEETRAILTPGAGPVLTAGQTTLVLQSAQATDSLSLFSWTAPDFGYDAGVKYTVQFSTAGTNFATTKNVNAGAKTDFKYTVANLNTTAKTNAGLTAGVEGQVEVRIKAEVSSLAAITSVDPLYSNTVVLNITPY